MRDRGRFWIFLGLLQLPLSYFLTAILIQQHFVKPPLDDTPYLQSGTAFVSLVGSYLPETAEGQFKLARTFTRGPAAVKLERELFGEPLRKLQESGRRQLFWLDAGRSRVTRDPENDNLVVVTIRGLSMSSDDEQPNTAAHDLAYTVVMPLETRRSVLARCDPSMPVVVEYRIGPPQNLTRHSLGSDFRKRHTSHSRPAIDGVPDGVTLPHLFPNADA